MRRTALSLAFPLPLPLLPQSSLPRKLAGLAVGSVPTGVLSLAVYHLRGGYGDDVCFIAAISRPIDFFCQLLQCFRQFFWFYQLLICQPLSRFSLPPFLQLHLQLFCLLTICPTLNLSLIIVQLSDFQLRSLSLFAQAVQLRLRSDLILGSNSSACLLAIISASF